MGKNRKWPVISRKKHEAIVESIRSAQMDHERELTRTLDQEKWDLRQVIQNLHEITLVYDVERTRWRIVLDFSPRIVEALERGNDERMLDYLVESLAYNIRRELKSMNIKRPADAGLGRRFKSWQRAPKTNSNSPEIVNPE